MSSRNGHPYNENLLLFDNNDANIPKIIEVKAFHAIMRFLCVLTTAPQEYSHPCGLRGKRRQRAMVGLKTLHGGEVQRRRHMTTTLRIGTTRQRDERS